MKLRGYLSLANLNKLIRDYSVNVRNIIDSASAKVNAKDGMMFNVAEDFSCLYFPQLQTRLINEGTLASLAHYSRSYLCTLTREGTLSVAGIWREGKQGPSFRSL